MKRFDMCMYAQPVSRFTQNILSKETGQSMCCITKSKTGTQKSELGSIYGPYSHLAPSIVKINSWNPI